MKYKLLLIAFLFPLYSALSQDEKINNLKKIFIRIGGGYNFRSGIGHLGQMYDNGDGTNTYTSVPSSYGKGADFSLSGGYMFTPNIGAELAFSYHFGGNTTSHNFYDHSTASNPYVDQQTDKYRSNMFYINPSIIISAGLHKINPYAKLGLVYGWAYAINEVHQDYIFTNGGKGFSDYEWRITGGSGLGFKSAIGIQFKTIDPTIDFFVELTHTSLGIAFKKGTLESASTNGKDILPLLTTSEKEYVYSDSETYSPCTGQNPNQDPNQPTQYLKYKSSFDNIGFNIGFIFRLK